MLRGGALVAIALSAALIGAAACGSDTFDGGSTGNDAAVAGNSTCVEACGNTKCKASGCGEACGRRCTRADYYPALMARLNDPALVCDGPTPLPPHERASASLRPTLYVTAMCCINETIASAWLEASLKTTTAPIARAALRELIADDVHHSRLGWAHLASSHVTPETRAKVAGWLPRLLDCTVVPWLRDARGSGDGVPTHGVPSEQTTQQVVVETVEQVVLPGLEAVGVDSGPAREWMNRVLPEIRSGADAQGTS